MLPAPRWFREVIHEWIAENGILCDTERAINELFTEMARRQPPSLTVIEGGKPASRREGIHD